jgi:hypothetical protein
MKEHHSGLWQNTRRKIGFSGNDAVGIILVNAQTGEIKEHSIVTKLGRPYSTELIEEQLNDWGIMYMDIGIFECKQIADYWRIDFSVR